MGKINILYIIWSLGLGGAEQVVINLTKGLDRNKFQPFICCLNNEGEFVDGVKSLGIKVFALNKIRGIDFSVIPKLVRIIRENNIQIVHTHLWGANFWGRWAAKVAGVPVIIATEHGIQEYRTRLHFFIDRRLSRFTDKIIFVSDFVREKYWKKISADYGKTIVVYNGIDISAFGKRSGDIFLRKEFGINDSERIISCIGRLAEEKGQAFLIDTLAKLNDGRMKVLMVGTGPLLQRLKSQVNGYKLDDKVIFTGLRKDVPGILDLTDILVLPSKREALPIILLEAMAAGVIVVATKVGGTPEVIQDSVNGFLVEYGDVEGLKNRLISILKMENGESKIEEIRLAAKKTVEEKFSLKKMIEKHEKIYDELIVHSL